MQLRPHIQFGPHGQSLFWHLSSLTFDCTISSAVKQLAFGAAALAKVAFLLSWTKAALGAAALEALPTAATGVDLFVATLLFIVAFSFLVVRR